MKTLHTMVWWILLTQRRNNMMAILALMNMLLIK